MDQATIAYWLTWVGTGAWVICFWWMHRISARQDALLTELRELAQTQHDILREVHPDVGEIKEHVVTEQGEKIDEIAQQVTQIADRGIASEAVGAEENATGTAAGKP
jgi:DNA-binding HxlR family transcriptional regulator